MQNLFLPFAYKQGRIVDGADRPVIHANRNNDETPLSPVDRDNLLKLTCHLLNKAFEYDEAEQFLNSIK